MPMASTAIPRLRRSAGKSCSSNSVTRFATWPESTPKTSETGQPKPRPKSSTSVFIVQRASGRRACSLWSTHPLGSTSSRLCEVVDHHSRLAAHRSTRRLNAFGDIRPAQPHLRNEAHCLGLSQFVYLHSTWPYVQNEQTSRL